MKALFMFDYVERTIVGSNSVLKKAGKAGSKEQRELLKMIEQHPDFKVVAKEIKVNSDRKTYYGLTLELMEEYICIQNDREAAMVIFNEVVKMAKAQGKKYPMTKKWFLERYKDFDVNKAKEAIDSYKIAQIDQANQVETDA